MLKKINNLLVQMKPLRVMLAILGLLVAIFAVAAGTKANYDGGIQVLQTLVLPALTPLVFLVLLLDALMNRVWLIDAKAENISKFRNIMRIDLIIAAFILFRWTPYFIEIWQ